MSDDTNKEMLIRMNDTLNNRSTKPKKKRKKEDFKGKEILTVSNPARLANTKRWQGWREKDSPSKVISYKLDDTDTI